jgi:hypothetical protein
MFFPFWYVWTKTNLATLVKMLTAGLQLPHALLDTVVSKIKKSETGRMAEF